MVESFEEACSVGGGIHYELDGVTTTACDL